MLLTLSALLMLIVCSTGTASANNSRIRKEARFLTDRMGYELNLNTRQYNDVYEINYDFILNVRHLMNDVLYGSSRAVEHYYDCLYLRNDDLRWILNPAQYRRFMQTEYFSRPIYAYGNRWYFRVHLVYTNHNHYYFPRPYHYRSYRGEHYRTYPQQHSHYRNRHAHSPYVGTVRMHSGRDYRQHHGADFGEVNNSRSSAGRSGQSQSSRRYDAPARGGREEAPAVRVQTNPSRGQGGNNSSVREKSSERVSGRATREEGASSRNPGVRNSGSAEQRTLPGNRERDNRERRSDARQTEVSTTRAESPSTQSAPSGVTTRRSEDPSSSRSSTRPSE